MQIKVGYDVEILVDVSGESPRDIPQTDCQSEKQSAIHLLLEPICRSAT